MKEAKVAFVGESSVGKTAILQQFIRGGFSQDIATTTATAFQTKTLEINGQLIKYNVWDTAGQERFRSLSAMYYRNAPYIIVVFDVTQPKSFTEARDFWVGQVRQNGVRNAEILLVGNKCDLPGRQIMSEEAAAFARQQGTIYFDCSAKTSEGVSEIFLTIGRSELNKNSTDDYDLLDIVEA